MEPLSLFHPYTKKWFNESIGTPTAVQDTAWPLIAAGESTLVSAPTGTGKTLSSFLVFIDRLMREALAGTLKRELQLIYVSPLKSLAGDIRENLRRPLEGIARVAREAGEAFDQEPIDIAIRTGDTTQSERRRMLKNPPHILITTPESLFLMLTAMSSQPVISTAKWIIIDELHALIDTKRGAHLMLSIARLDRLCKAPLQRIGLSATIEPLSIAAEYLAPEGASIAAPKMEKLISLQVTSPLPMGAEIKKNNAWHEIAKTILERCQNTRSVIAFVEGRAYAERLAYHINEIAGDGFARTHHGSMSKEHRLEVEHALRAGTLRLLCATSSMELGIDVGEIDQVFQVGCPRTISSTMQRLGRAGHNPNRVSAMHIFPRTPVEGLYSGLTCEVVKMGGVEQSHPPRLCLDVLAQHLVSMAAGRGYELSEVLEIAKRAWPFRELTLLDVRETLRMLAGDYEHDRDIPVRPRVLYDRIHDRVEADPYSRMLAVSAGGTIPDKGLYTCKTENGVTLGELDEEFIYETRVGDRFLLGSFGWQIANIQKDTVTVIPANPQGARLPFWKGEIKGRSLKTGLAFGSILRRLTKASESGKLLYELTQMSLDAAAAENAAELVKRQISFTGTLPDDRTIIVEHYRDEANNPQMMIHSIFGRPVNEPLAILAAEAARQKTGMNVNYVADDDGMLLFPYGDRLLPQKLLLGISPEGAAAVINAMLPASQVYNMAFRYNASRALMMGMKSAGRQPLWVQRMRSAQMLDALVREHKHPIVRETRRECLEDYWDVEGVKQILSLIRSGEIRVVELHQESPSPLSLTLRRQTEASMMYEYFPTPMRTQAAVEEALEKAQMIPPEEGALKRVAERTKLPENEVQLHSLLMIEGDLVPGELEIPPEWLESLEEKGRAAFIDPGLWIAQEQTDQYEAAFSSGVGEAKSQIFRRLLRYRGPKASWEIAQRYGLAEDAAQAVLTALSGSGEVVEHEGLYYHGQLYERAVRETVMGRRTRIRTLPPQRYAALLASRVQRPAPPKEQLEEALKALCGLYFPAAQWESLLLPLRVGAFRPEMLDAILSQGHIFWRMRETGELGFHLYEDIDWEGELELPLAEPNEREKLLMNALKQRGASFAHSLSSLMGEASVFDVLIGLAVKGLTRADSFVPVRQWLLSDQNTQVSLRRKVNARVMATTSGRWELMRPLKTLSMEQQLNRAFEQVGILCRETAQNLNWGEAVKLLRLWEYTGRVRRGYFIEGMSGMQFIRDSDYSGITQMLEAQSVDIVWLPAIDPMQPYGKYLPHMPDRSFMNLPGNLVALKGGVPVAVLERQGKTLKLFDTAALDDALSAFAKEYAARRAFPALNRITLKEYPKDAADSLQKAGFKTEMQDFVLYRGYV